MSGFDGNAGHLLAQLGLGHHAVEEVASVKKLECGSFSIITASADHPWRDDNGDDEEGGVILHDGDSERHFRFDSMEEYDQLLSLLISARESARAHLT